VSRPGGSGPVRSGQEKGNSSPKPQRWLDPAGPGRIASTSSFSTPVPLTLFGPDSYSPCVAHRSVCSLGERLSNSGAAELVQFGQVRSVFCLTLSVLRVECLRGQLIPRRPNVTHIHHSFPGSDCSDRGNGLEDGTRRAGERFRAHGQRIGSDAAAVERHSDCGKSVAKRIGSNASAMERHPGCGKTVAKRIGSDASAMERHPGCGKTVAKRIGSDASAMERHPGCAQAIEPSLSGRDAKVLVTQKTPRSS
jgi:hypothetical protein